MLTRILPTLLLAAVSSGSPEVGFPAPSGPIKDAIDHLEASLEATDEGTIENRATQAIKRLGEESPAGEQLMAILAAGPKDATKLKLKLKQVHQQLLFEPRCEAPLPEDFPAYTPVGAIEVKSYPRSRRAVANDFFTLFAHISSKQIAMTAPVRMEYQTSLQGALVQQSMAFYYQTVNTGHVGNQGAVTAVEDAGETVVSLGCRGDTTDESLQDGHRLLRNWLHAHPEYEPAGELIVMGYNSPMVPVEDRFYEVQLSIQHAAAK